jgi:hypothetical protein
MSELNLFRQFEGEEIADEFTHDEFSESIDLAWPSPAQSTQQELGTLAVAGPILAEAGPILAEAGPILAEAGTNLAEAMDQAEAGLPTAAASAQNAQEIDLATKAGRMRIHTARDYLANSTNYARTCKQQGIKLFLAYTAATKAPDETIATLENGIRNESASQVRQAFSSIVAYSWALPYSLQLEELFNCNKVRRMAGFLTRGRIGLLHFAEELRNTDFVQFTAKPIEILTWAAYPDPEQRLSPSVLAVNAYAAISRYETRKINRDCRRNGISLRLQV